MPYRWTTAPTAAEQEMQLWPHQSLPARGMAAFVLATFVMILLPALTVIGTPILWGLLPFLLLAIWALYFALQRNHRARQIREVFTLTPELAHLVRVDPKGRTQDWEANLYWTRVQKYEDEGPVPHYVTLKGTGREVEIGAFLSEEERIALFDELERAISRMRPGPP